MASPLALAVRQRLLDTIVLIAEYYDYRRSLYEEGVIKKLPKGFTYKGLQTWMHRTGRLKKRHWHTIERKIRRLAELGYLRRVPRGPIMIFYPTARFWQVVEQHQQYLQQQAGVKQGA